MYLQAQERTKTKLRIVFIFTQDLKQNKTMLGIDFNFYTSLKTKQKYAWT
jgi:hypothetical protein